MSDPLPSPASVSSPRRVLTEDSFLLKEQPGPKWQTKEKDQQIEVHVESVGHPTASALRRSLYLRPYFLIGLAVLFALFVTALEVLRYVSDANQGFVSSDEGKHFLWTYGPTFAAVWGQVEYRVIQATPWLELKRRALPAKRNLLINYVSPWSVTVLYRSLSAGHFAVTLVVLGGLLLKALIIVSTGLIDLEPMRSTYETQFSLTNQFNLSRGRFESPVNPADPRVALWAFVQGEGTVQYPAGTTPEYAILSASPSTLTNGSNLTFTADLPVFSVDQTCTSFSWTFNSSTGRNTSLADIITDKNELDLLSRYCLLSDMFVPRLLFKNDTKTPYLTSEVSSRGLRQPVLNRTNIVGTECRKAVGDPYPESAGIFSSVLVPLQGNTSMASAVLCLPQYSVTRRRVTMTPGENVLDVSGEVIEKIEIPDMATAAGSLTNDILAIGEGMKLKTSILTNSWIGTMNLTTPRPDYRDFANATLLSVAFQKSFRALAALTVRTQKAVPAAKEETVPGNVTLSISRLTITSVTVRVMESLLAVLIFVALALCALHMGPRYESAPTLLDTALILARSDWLSQTLSIRGREPTDAGVAAALKGKLFYSTHNGGTAVHVEDHTPGIEEDTPETKPKWWLPMAASRTYAAVLIITTLAAIAVLEALYQVSQKQGGITEVSTVGYTRYAWLFLPTLCMASIGLAYVSMDRATQTLHPFLQLAQGKGTKDTLEFEPRSSLALVALIQTLRRRFFGLSAVIMTSILGGVLTIAASGLYTPSTTITAGAISLDPTSWFDLRTELTGTESDLWGGFAEIDILPSAFEFNNLSLPAGVYAEFAFALPDPAAAAAYHSPSSPSKLLARLPAVRVQPNCSLHDFRPLFDDKDVAGPYAQVDPPAGCLNGPGGVPVLGAKLLLGSPDSDREGYVGFRAIPYWNFSPSEGELFNSSNGDYDKLNFTTPLCLDGTRYDFFMYGFREGTVTTNLTTIRCAPYTEAVVVEGTFHFPNFTVDETAAAAPRVVGGMEEVRPWSFANRTLNSVNGAGLRALSGRDANLDDFFMTLARGRSSSAQMAALTPRDALPQMLDRITAVHQELTALTMHFSYRASPEPAVEGRPNPGPITGTIRAQLPAGRARLVQNELSTRLLEGLLAALVVFAGASWFILGREGAGVKRGEVLPLDPGSVAGRMALLAGNKEIK
ncbi:hypothetical protein QBC47DRAFT_364602 [Echria macrotheca]|uniref:Uncharacterized protein n=1 Tax=Echria macrotheca TaxID=438768 RepID=A0AAJ0B3T5_9PEZI|nr:hypothetical protein QBC47DRAFT_364602 [Echria macrotheca]